MAPESKKHKWLEKIDRRDALVLSTAFVATAPCLFAAPVLAPFFMMGALSYVMFRHLTQVQDQEKTLKKSIRSVQSEYKRLAQDLAQTREQISQTPAPAKPRAEPARPTPQPEDESALFARILETAQNKMDSEVSPGKAEPAIGSIAPLPHEETQVIQERTNFSDTIVQELLETALEKNKVEIFMQPVVRLPQRQTAFYELYARLRAGNGIYVPARRALPIAHKTNLAVALDNAVLLRCFENLRKQKDIAGDHPPSFFLNVTAKTFTDTKYIADLLAFVEKHPSLAARLIFEFNYVEFLKMGVRSHKLLQNIARLGCRFSVDTVRDPRIDTVQMKGAGVSFVKMDAANLIAIAARSRGLRFVQSFQHNLQTAGLTLIADRIEHESTVREILDFNITYGQGNLFATASTFGPNVYEHLKRTA